MKSFAAVACSAFLALVILVASIISLAGPWWFRHFHQDTVSDILTADSYDEYSLSNVHSVTTNGNANSVRDYSWAQYGSPQTADLFKMTKTMMIIGLILSILFVIVSLLRAVAPKMPHDQRHLFTSKLVNGYLIVHTILMVIFFAIAAYHFSSALPHKWQADAQASNDSGYCSNGQNDCGSFSGSNTVSMTFLNIVFSNAQLTWGSMRGWIWAEVAMTGSILAVVANIIAYVFAGQTDYSSLY